MQKYARTNYLSPNTLICNLGKTLYLGLQITNIFLLVFSSYVIAIEQFDGTVFIVRYLFLALFKNYIKICLYIII